MQLLEKIQDDPFLATMFYAFENEFSMFIVMEFAQGGEMYQLLKRHRTGFTMVQARFYIAEVILALELLHKVKTMNFRRFRAFKSSFFFRNKSFIAI